MACLDASCSPFWSEVPSLPPFSGLNRPVINEEAQLSRRGRVDVLSGGWRVHSSWISLWLKFWRRADGGSRERP